MVDNQIEDKKTKPPEVGPKGGVVDIIDIEKIEKPIFKKSPKEGSPGTEDI